MYTRVLGGASAAMFVATSEAWSSVRLSARVSAVTFGRAGGLIMIRLQDSSLLNKWAMENVVKAQRSDMHRSNVSTSGCLITETCCRVIGMDCDKQQPAEMS